MRVSVSIYLNYIPSSETEKSPASGIDNLYPKKQKKPNFIPKSQSLKRNFERDDKNRINKLNLNSEKGSFYSNLFNI